MGFIDMMQKFLGVKSDKTEEKKSATAAKELTVYVAEGGKVYHLSDECTKSNGMIPMSESEAIQRGLCKCKSCFWGYREEIARNEKILDILDCSLFGCIYPNPDGTSRQTYLINCKEGENVYFHPAPTKEYPDTIGVFTKKGGCIGVLPYKTVNELRGMYAHNKAEAIITEIIHSERGLGCRIKIIIYK